MQMRDEIHFICLYCSRSLTVCSPICIAHISRAINYLRNKRAFFPFVRSRSPAPACNVRGTPYCPKCALIGAGGRTVQPCVHANTV